MKRSEINRAIRVAKDALNAHQFYLPPFAYWAPEQWRDAGPQYERVRANGLGWDVTDFGMGDFDDLGGVLFTLRNGNYDHPEQGTPYAEKMIILTPGQRMPLHFHWSKTEDIINRGGGVLMMEMYRALPDESVDKVSPVDVWCDGCKRTVRAGEVFAAQPGGSITVQSGTYHRFWAAPEGGILLCGEVSKVNDDRTDNRFAEQIQRFVDIEEDELALHLLANEYPNVAR
jgi:D-lyxose ketol-isomerase